MSSLSSFFGCRFCSLFFTFFLGIVSITITNSGPRNFLHKTMTESEDSKTEIFSPDEISVVFLDYRSSHHPVCPNPRPLTRDVFTKQFIKLLQSLIIFLVQLFPELPNFIKSFPILFTSIFPLLSSLPCEIPLIFLVKCRIFYIQRYKGIS